MKLIIFDVYGTLISTGTGSLDVVKRFWHYKIKISARKSFIYQYILRKEQCGKEDAVFAGDSYVDDVCGSGKVGTKSVLIDRKHCFCRDNSGCV